MNARTLLLIALIVILPMSALAWTGFRLVRNEQVVLQQRFRDLMQGRLQDVNDGIRRFFRSFEADLNRASAIDEYGVDGLRERNRREPRIFQLFVLSPEGRLVFPDPNGVLNQQEQLFLLQASGMFTGRDLHEAVLREAVPGEERENSAGPSRLPSKGSADSARHSAADESSDSGRSSDDQPAISLVEQTLQSNIRQSNIRQSDTMQSDTRQSDTRQSDTRQSDTRQSDTRQSDTRQSDTRQSDTRQSIDGESASPAPSSFRSTSGWFSWYWERGLHLIYWQRRPSGHVVGAATLRARWMADLIAELPETIRSSASQANGIPTRLRLVTESGADVYQWGTFDPPSGTAALCEIPAADPLSAWRLQCFVPAETAAGTGTRFPLLLSLGGIAAVLMLIVCVFLREYSRDMREAAQQVSFVNQVSHELKTPLTNIRMYAELLDRDLDTFATDDVHRPRERLSVILSEGARLSRLIGNVLTFARHRRQTLQRKPTDVVPGTVVRRIVDRFRPVFARLNVDCETDYDMETRLCIDTDFLEQILGNLLSNVEKYAASGGRLSVTARIENHLLIVDVRDSGPGIPPDRRKDIFRPFARISNTVSSAAGTGIGLSIARELARLHGGDVVLQDSPQGCWFQATLRHCANSGEGKEQLPAQCIVQQGFPRSRSRETSEC